MSDRTPFYSALAASMLAGLPGAPNKFTKRYVEDVIARCDRRINVLEDRIEGVAEGRVMPDRDDVTIGSGRRFNLAILFLDICGSARSSSARSRNTVCTASSEVSYLREWKGGGWIRFLLKRRDGDSARRMWRSAGCILLMRSCCWLVHRNRES
jgi:hypothetical protein